MLKTCVLALIALGMLAMPLSAQNSSRFQPFTAQSNYMSLRGYKRWQHFKNTGVWIPLVVTQKVEYDGGDTVLTETLGRELLALSVEENPFAVQHTVSWTNNMMTTSTLGNSQNGMFMKNPNLS